VVYTAGSQERDWVNDWRGGRKTHSNRRQIHERRLYCGSEQPFTPSYEPVGTSYKEPLLLEDLSMRGTAKSPMDFTPIPPGSPQPSMGYGFEPALPNLRNFGGDVEVLRRVSKAENVADPIGKELHLMRVNRFSGKYDRLQIASGRNEVGYLPTPRQQLTYRPGADFVTIGKPYAGMDRVPTLKAEPKYLPSNEPPFWVMQKVRAGLLDVCW